MFSVLKRKWGLIWLISASMRAWSSAFSWSTSLRSIRVVFQMRTGSATPITVARTIKMLVHVCGELG